MLITLASEYIGSRLRSFYLESSMELRWFVERVAYQHWDDREGVYVTSTHESDPVLQYRDAKDNRWKDLPTYYAEISR